MWIFDELLAWAGTALLAISSPASRAQPWSGVDFVVRVGACSDHLDLFLAAKDGPVLASCANDFNLFEEVSLVPAELYLRDLVVLIEVDKVSL